MRLNKIKLLIVTTLLLFSLTGCRDSSVSVNVENSETITQTHFGELRAISGHLWYDPATEIVYWWNGWWVSEVANMPTPYYAPNGLPYRYNPETNTFEEINMFENMEVE